MLMRRRLVVAATIVATRLPAQAHRHGDHDATASRDSISAMATGLVTRAAPASFGVARSEWLVTQPMLMARGARLGGALRYAAMLNAEHWTMPDGEPVAGIWGEGFIDRRHPHTVVHELMVTAVRQRANGSAASLSLGRGIIPFGTDDPMVRPFTKYPANHHYAQLLERIQLVGALRLSRRAGLELSAFNGDEPVSPTAAPQWRRFGDSRAARLTLWPVDRVEVQGSAAAVRSPEFAGGQGLDQRKWSASARWSRGAGLLRYALAEWARTEDRYRARPIAGYGTGLVEGLAMHRRLSVAVRLEQTSRHEEERLLDPFRTARPPSDLSILGITRWRLITAQVAVPMPTTRWLHGSAFLEGTRAQSAPVLRPVLVDPASVIGNAVAWHVSAGLRLGAGAMPRRVGRYGAASGNASTDVALTMPPHE